jgi:hypothetical protein
MPCCSGHTCDYCATCKLGVCCNEGKSRPQYDPVGVPIGVPRTRPSEPATAPQTRPAVPV